MKSTYYVLSFIIFVVFVVIVQFLHVKNGYGYQMPKFLDILSVVIYLNSVIASIMVFIDVLRGK